MKRYLIATGVAGMVFAGALGSASMLGVNPGVAQTGHEYLRGDSNGVKVDSYGYESDNNSSYSVKIVDVDPNLAGEKMWAQIYDGAGNRLAKASAVIDGSTVTTVRWAAPVPVEKIESIRLTIE